MVDVLDMTARAVEPTGAHHTSGLAGSATRAFPQQGFYRAHGKRLVDVVLVLLASVIVVPVVAVLAVIIACDGGSPFYRQERVGHGGRRFMLLKLRTMIPNAEAELQRMLRSNQALAAEWHQAQKLREDPRITWFGRFLRASSLDELPQLLNVLLGDMSLVGPRPMMLDQQGLYGGAPYCDLRPGLTGLWQVSARNAEGFASRVDYDRQYEAQLSFLFDIRLMVRTIFVVMRGTGC